SKTSSPQLWPARIGLFSYPPTGISDGLNTLLVTYGRQDVLSYESRSTRLFRVSEGYVRAEADHADAGGKALAAAQRSAGFQPALQRNREQDDEKVRGGIQRNRKTAEHDELPENVAVLRRDELRNEGKKEQRGLWVQHLGHDALAEGSQRGARGAQAPFRVARADHADAEPNEIRGAGKLDGVKRHRGRGEDRGNPRGCGKNVHQPSEEGAERRMKTFAAASRERPCQNVENPRPGRDGQNHRRGQKQQETMSIKHRNSLRDQIRKNRMTRCRVSPR